MLVLFLIRHGLSEGNKNRIIQGLTQASLSADGIAQAQKLAPRLKEEQFDFVYSSDLDRAVETAEIIKPEVKPVLLPLLREQFMGKWEGRTFADIEREYPEEFRKVFIEHTMPDTFGAENGIQLRKRGGEFLNFLTEKHSSGRILVVSHGGLIHAMAEYVSGGETPLGIPNNCSINILVYSGSRWWIHAWNDTGHLSQKLFSYTVE